MRIELGYYINLIHNYNSFGYCCLDQNLSDRSLYFDLDYLNLHLDSILLNYNIDNLNFDLDKILRISNHLEN